MKRLKLREANNLYRVIKLDNSRSVIQIQGSDPQTHASSDHRADGQRPAWALPCSLSWSLMNFATSVCPGGGGVLAEPASCSSCDWRSLPGQGFATHILIPGTYLCRAQSDEAEIPIQFSQGFAHSENIWVSLSAGHYELGGQIQTQPLFSQSLPVEETGINQGTLAWLYNYNWKGPWRSLRSTDESETQKC